MLGKRRLYNLGALSLPLSSHTSFVLGVGFSKLVRRAESIPYREPPRFIYLEQMNVQVTHRIPESYSVMSPSNPGQGEGCELWSQIHLHLSTGLAIFIGTMSLVNNR